MKKIALFVLSAIVISSIGFSQIKQGTGKDKKEKTSQSTPRIKKDGTVDKRYKAVKDTAVIRKKDGTPDMRYKKSKKG